MFNQYEILKLDDNCLNYKIKYKYLVMRYCGADSKQVPIYNLIKKCRTEKRAVEYIKAHLTDQPLTD